MKSVDQAPVENATTASRQPDLRLAEVLFALGLLAAMVVFYSPALTGAFLWDDDMHITADWALRSLHGLMGIWCSPGVTCQYYPLTFTVFWADYHLWATHTLGYHLQNIVLHWAGAMLLWRLLAKLEAPGAALAGAIFALHPLNVMSVAWMTELKNTLSGSLALGAALAYIRFAGLGVYGKREIGASRRTQGNRWYFYALALAMFLLAMCAKTAVSFLPLTLLLVVWWKRGKIGWRDVLTLLPMLCIAIGMDKITVYVEQHTGAAAGSEFQLGMMERVLVSGRSFWFYLWKFLFPLHLPFIYARWDVDAGNWTQYLWPAAMVSLLAGLWLARREIGRGIWVAMMHFYISTSMLVLGVVLYMMRYSFVANHWAYFGTMSLSAMAAAGVEAGMRRFGVWETPIGRKIVLGLILALGGLTCWQSRMYTDSVALWSAAAAQSPDSSMAHDNLGKALTLAGRPQEAIVEHVKALKIEPESWDAYNDLGTSLMADHRIKEAIACYVKSLTINPTIHATEFNLGNALLFYTGDVDDAIAHLEKYVAMERATGVSPGSADSHYDLGIAYTRKGRYAEAAGQYREALEIDPTFSSARGKLAWLLATCPDKAARNGEEALRLAEAAVAAVQTAGGDADPKALPRALQTLAAADAECGRYAEAVKNAQQALASATMNSDMKMVEELEAQIEAYSAGKAFHEEAQAP